MNGRRTPRRGRVFRSPVGSRRICNSRPDCWTGLAVAARSMFLQFAKSGENWLEELFECWFRAEMAQVTAGSVKKHGAGPWANGPAPMRGRGGTGCSPHPFLLFPSEKVFGGILPVPGANRSTKRTGQPAVEGVTAHVISNSKPGCRNQHLQRFDVDPRRAPAPFPAETRTGDGIPPVSACNSQGSPAPAAGSARTRSGSSACKTEVPQVRVPTVRTDGSGDTVGRGYEQNTRASRQGLAGEVVWRSQHPRSRRGWRPPFRIPWSGHLTRLRLTEQEMCSIFLPDRKN